MSSHAELAGQLAQQLRVTTTNPSRLQGCSFAHGAVCQGLLGRKCCHDFGTVAFKAVACDCGRPWTSLSLSASVRSVLPSRAESSLPTVKQDQTTMDVRMEDEDEISPLELSPDGAKACTPLCRNGRALGHGKADTAALEISLFLCSKLPLPSTTTITSMPRQHRQKA